MNLNFAIPQLFYDIIGKIFPGSLLFLEVALFSRHGYFPYFPNEFQSILDGQFFQKAIFVVFIGYAIWIIIESLSMLVIQIAALLPWIGKSAKGKAEEYFGAIKSPNLKSIAYKYDMVKNVLPNVGLRVTKIRAEATGVKCLAIGQAVIALLMLIEIWLSRYSLKAYTTVAMLAIMSYSFMIFRVRLMKMMSITIENNMEHVKSESI
jgi:hypothetical protein